MSSQPAYRNLEQEAANRVREAEEQRQQQENLRISERIRQQKLELEQNLKKPVKKFNSKKARVQNKTSTSRQSFRKLISQPGGLKQAVVMKEILERKY